jgi:hypothetical protein
VQENKLHEGLLCQEEEDEEEMEGEEANRFSNWKPLLSNIEKVLLCLIKHYVVKEYEGGWWLKVWFQVFLTSALDACQFVWCTVVPVSMDCSIGKKSSIVCQQSMLRCSIPAHRKSSICRSYLLGRIKLHCGTKPGARFLLQRRGTLLTQTTRYGFMTPTGDHTLTL